MNELKQLSIRDCLMVTTNDCNRDLKRPSQNPANMYASL